MQKGCNPSDPAPCTDSFLGNCPGLAAQVGALHALGPDYQSTFSPLESDAALEQMPAAAALVVDGKEALGPRLLFSYNAQVIGRRLKIGPSKHVAHAQCKL